VNVEIIRASGDLSGAARLLERFLQRGGGRGSPEFETRLEEHVASGCFEVFVARLRGVEVGVATASYRPSAALGGEFAAIEDLYVEPGSRGRGVASALVRAVEDRCRERGISYVEVQVSGTEEFYERLGYEEEPGVRVLSRSVPLGQL
jgi:GNAT superfamily N-acetyltransferase